MSDEQTVERILSYARRIAIVGLSSKPDSESLEVATALKERGYEIVPVNPNEEEVLGEKAYPSLADVPGEIDVVDVFRKEEVLPDVAAQAVEIDAKAVWNQLGLTSDKARRIAEEAGLDYVEDHCMKKETRRRGG